VDESGRRFTANGRAFHWLPSKPPEQRKVIETRSELESENLGETLCQRMRQNGRDTRASWLIISTPLGGQGLEGDERVQAVVRV
jgi:hypothetical protein